MQVKPASVSSTPGDHPQLHLVEEHDNTGYFGTVALTVQASTPKTSYNPHGDTVSGFDTRNAANFVGLCGTGSGTVVTSVPTSTAFVDWAIGLEGVRECRYVQRFPDHDRQQ